VKLEGRNSVTEGLGCGSDRKFDCLSQWVARSEGHCTRAHSTQFDAALSRLRPLGGGGNKPERLFNLVAILGIYGTRFRSSTTSGKTGPVQWTSRLWYQSAAGYRQSCGRHAHDGAWQSDDSNEVSTPRTRAGETRLERDKQQPRSRT